MLGMGTARKYCCNTVWKGSLANPSLEGKMGVLRHPSEAFIATPESQNDSCQLFHLSFFFSPERTHPCIALCSDAAMVSWGSPVPLPAQPRNGPFTCPGAPRTPYAEPCPCNLARQGREGRQSGQEWGAKVEGVSRRERPGLLFVCGASGFWEVRYLGSCFSSRCWRAPGPTLPTIINHAVAGSPPSLWGSWLQGCLPLPLSLPLPLPLPLSSCMGLCSWGWMGQQGCARLGHSLCFTPAAPRRRVGTGRRASHRVGRTAVTSPSSPGPPSEPYRGLGKGLVAPAQLGRERALLSSSTRGGPLGCIPACLPTSRHLLVPGPRRSSVQATWFGGLTCTCGRQVFSCFKGWEGIWAPFQKQNKSKSKLAFGVKCSHAPQSPTRDEAGTVGDMAYWSCPAKGSQWKRAS